FVYCNAYLLFAVFYNIDNANRVFAFICNIDQTCGLHATYPFGNINQASHLVISNIADINNASKLQSFMMLCRINNPCKLQTACIDGYIAQPGYLYAGYTFTDIGNTCHL